MNSFIITEFKFPIKFGQIILFPEYGENVRPLKSLSDPKPFIIL